MISNREIKKAKKSETIRDEELGLEIEGRIHDFKTKYKEVKAPKDWRYVTMDEAVKIIDKYAEQIGMHEKEWKGFWIEQPSEKNKILDLGASAIRYGNSGLSLLLSRTPAYSSDWLGVLFVKDSKVKGEKKK